MPGLLDPAVTRVQLRSLERQDVLDGAVRNSRCFSSVARSLLKPVDERAASAWRLEQIGAGWNVVRKLASVCISQVSPV